MLQKHSAAVLCSAQELICAFAIGLDRSTVCCTEKNCNLLSYFSAPRLALAPHDDASFMRVLNEPKRRLGPAVQQKLMEEKQNVLLELQQEQEGQQRQQGQQVRAAGSRSVPEVSMYSVAKRLLAGSSLATLHRKPLQGFLSLLDKLAIEVMELTPAQAVARVLEVTGLAAAVKENQRKKREKAAEAAAEAVVQVGGKGEASGSLRAGRDQQGGASVSKVSRGGAGTSRHQQQQQESARTATAGSDEESEVSSEEISDSDEEDVEDELVARERASVSQVGTRKYHSLWCLEQIESRHCYWCFPVASAHFLCWASLLWTRQPS